MGLRVCIMLAVLIAVSSLSAFAAVAPAAPAAGSMVYPGANLQFEMSLTDKDFLPAIKQFLPSLPGLVAQHVQSDGPKESPEVAAACAQLQGEQFAKDLMDALSGLHKVSIGGYTIKSADGDKILQFYAQRLGLSSGWLQPLRVNDPKGTFRLYVKPDLEEMFGLFVQSPEFIVIRTEGKVDITKLAKVAALLIPAVMSSDKPQPVQTPPPAVDQPAPPAPPAAPANP
jgi:hypothetical protein